MKKKPSTMSTQQQSRSSTVLKKTVTMHQKKMVVLVMTLLLLVSAFGVLIRMNVYPSVPMVLSDSISPTFACLGGDCTKANNTTPVSTTVSPTLPPCETVSHSAAVVQTGTTNPSLGTQFQNSVGQFFSQLSETFSGTVTHAPTTSSSVNECASLNVSADAGNCGLNASGVGLFCGGNCGVKGNANTLYQCQGKVKIGVEQCSTQCITCKGKNLADQCGSSTSVCGPGASSTSIGGMDSATPVTPPITPLPTAPCAPITPKPVVSTAPVTPPSGSTPVTPKPVGQPVSIAPQDGDFWAGYVYDLPANSSNATIETTLNVPSASCVSGAYAFSPWIGFGGFYDDNLPQLGYDVQCSGSSTAYHAWTEAFPAASVYYNKKISAGDKIYLKITYTGGGKFITYMKNVSKSWDLTVPMTYKDAPISGEYIMERLEGSGTILPTFQPFIFSGDVISRNGAAKQPLANALNLQNLYLSKNSVQQTENSPVNNDSFNLIFKHK